MDKKTENILTKVGIGVGTALTTAAIVYAVKKVSSKGSGLPVSPALPNTSPLTISDGKEKFVNTMQTIKQNYNGLPGMLIHAPRGIKNNNPGNIKLTNEKWRGKVPKHLNSDGTFEQFETFPHGIRAMIMTLYTYFHVKNKRTVHDIMHTYAPTSENKTDSYISAVCLKLGVTPKQKLSWNKDIVKKFVSAIYTHENGHKWRLRDSDYNAGMNLVPISKRPR